MIRRVACGIAAATAAVCAVAGPMAADDPGSLEVLPAQGNVHVLAAPAATPPCRSDRKVRWSSIRSPRL